MLQPLPDPFFADRFDKVFDMRLCEVLIIVLYQLRVDSGHGHEHINQGRLGAQQHLPHLTERKREREREMSTKYDEDDGRDHAIEMITSTFIPLEYL